MNKNVQIVPLNETNHDKKAAMKCIVHRFWRFGSAFISFTLSLKGKNPAPSHHRFVIGEQPGDLVT